MKGNRRKLAVAFWISIISFVTLTTAAYAWMSIASAIKVTDMALTIVSENALELAPDVDGVAGEWTTVIEMSDMLGGDTVLKPITYSAQRDTFLAPRYGLDGRADFSDPLVITQTQTGAQVSSSAEAAEETGYLLVFDFWIRTGAANCTVCLAEPVETAEGVQGGGCYVVGRPVWDTQAVCHEDGGSGAQNAIRIAFRSYDEENGSEGSFVIYEPNADSSGSYETTPGIDGTDSLVAADSLILQSTSGWSEQTPVLKDSVVYNTGEFMSEKTAAFTLKAGVARRVTMYIWLEGQDVDCVNSISAARLIANIQFTAVAGSPDEVIVAR